MRAVRHIPQNINHGHCKPILLFPLGSRPRSLKHLSSQGPDEPLQRNGSGDSPWRRGISPLISLSVSRVLSSAPSPSPNTDELRNYPASSLSKMAMTLSDSPNAPEGSTTSRNRHPSRPSRFKTVSSSGTSLDVKPIPFCFIVIVLYSYLVMVSPFLIDHNDANHPERSDRVKPLVGIYLVNSIFFRSLFILRSSILYCSSSTSGPNDKVEEIMA